MRKETIAWAILFFGLLIPTIYIVPRPNLFDLHHYMTKQYDSEYLADEARAFGIDMDQDDWDEQVIETIEAEREEMEATYEYQNAVLGR